MNEAMIWAVLKRTGTDPVERLAWAVDFAQRPILTPGDLSNAELELTCFLLARNLMHLPNLPEQIKALMTNPAWKVLPYRGQEIADVQARFSSALRAAAGVAQIELPLKYVTVQFTRSEGANYISSIPSLRHDKPERIEERKEAKRELAVFKLVQLLDQTVRTSLAKAKGRGGFVPVRMYVGICPEAIDGCGKLFAKTRIDQDYCSRTCVSRAQVRRFRKNHAAKSRKKP